MAVGHSSATGRTSHYHVGADKRNLDLLDDLKSVASSAVKATIATPTSGILNTVRNSMSNGNQQDSSSLTTSSVIGCVGAFGILDKYAAQSNATNTLIRNFSSNPAIMSDFAIAHNAFHNRKNDLNTDIAANGIVKTLSNKCSMNLYFSNSLPSGNLNINNTSDYYNFRSEVIKIANDRGLGDVIKNGQQILNRQNELLKDANDELSKLTAGGKKTKFTRFEQDKIDKIRNSISNINENISICKSGMQFKSVEDRYKPSSKKITGLGVGVGIGVGVFNSVLRNASNTESYQGYQTLRQYKNYTKIVAKLAYRQYKALYKFVGRPIITNVGGRSLRFIANRLSASNPAVSKFINSALTRIGNAERNVGFAINTLSNKEARGHAVRTAKNVVTSATRSGVRLVGRGAANLLSRTGVGRKILGGAKVVGRLAGRGLGFVSVPFRFIGGAFAKATQIISSIKSFLDPKEWLKKIAKKIVKHLLSLIMSNIIPAMFIVIILTVFANLMTIVDAISSTYEKFISETTMGATYAKLLDKERDFAAQVSSLTEEKVPDGIGHDIREWTNYKVHFIGADGKEMSNSLESTGGYSMIGTGFVNGEIGSMRNEASDRIWTYMKQNGWTDQATAALMGNIYNECSMNYRANGKQDIGIVQWTDNSQVKRKTKYIQWATSNGYDPLDLEAQLKYLFKEPHHGDTVRKMANKTDLVEATRYFIEHYEMYKNYMTDEKERNERINAARNYYNYYTTHEPFNNIDADESLIASNAGSASDTNISSGNFETIASNYNVNTIKGILTMAYIYIDRDFKKYGSLTDKLWGDSVYKDYCAKLYDSTHIIALNKDTPKVYYCPNYQADENGSDDQVVEYPEATDSCNNFIPSGQTESSDSSITRPTVITYTVQKATYEKTTVDRTRPNEPERTEHVQYDKYTVHAAGAYGTVTYSYNKGERNSWHDAYQEALAELKARGGKNFLNYCIDETQDSKTCVLVSNDPVCKGHIDGEAFVFVSNIYDPSNEKDPAKAQTSVQEDNSADGGTTENQTSLAKPNDNKLNNSVRMIAKSVTNKSGFQINAFAAPNDDEYDDSEDTDTETDEENDDNVDDDELINFRQTGWQNIRGNWYYIDELSHDKIVNKRKVIKGSDGLNYYYFFDEDGKMLTGFKTFQYDGKEFKRYFGSDGAMKFGWQEIDGKWYYFADRNNTGHLYGQMYINEKTPDGYEVGEDGIWKDKKETQTNTNNNSSGSSGNSGSSGSSGSSGNTGNSNNGSSDSSGSSGNSGSSNYDKQREENQRNDQNEKKPYSYIGYNYIDKKQAESRYSMYALDKYATAFNDPSQPTEIEEEEVDIDNPTIKNKKIIKINGRVGDEESVNEANQYSDSHAGEKFVMDDLVKKYYESKGINKEPNLEIKNWWNNESWFTNLSTTKTYYRIYNDDTKNIDSLGNKSNNPNDKNVVNTSNSKPFWFNAFTSESGRNENFEKHGWDDSSIQQVRLILADNWEERYGVVIQNTMNVTPLSDAEIAAILQNENLDGLSDKRKSILATVIKFQKNVAEPFDTRYLYRSGHDRLKSIEQITSGDKFDCSSYTSTIYYNAGIDNKMMSTADYRSSYKKVPMSDLKPGDLIVTPKHVVIYLGGGLISHASTSKKPLKTTYRVDGSKYFKTGNIYRPNGLD